MLTASQFQNVIFFEMFVPSSTLTELGNEARQNEWWFLRCWELAVSIPALLKAEGSGSCRTPAAGCCSVEECLPLQGNSFCT